MIKYCNDYKLPILHEAEKFLTEYQHFPKGTFWFLPKKDAQWNWLKRRSRISTGQWDVKLKRWSKPRKSKFCSKRKTYIILPEVILEIGGLLAFLVVFFYDNNMSCQSYMLIKFFSGYNFKRQEKLFSYQAQRYQRFHIDLSICRRKGK